MLLGRRVSASPINLLQRTLPARPFAVSAFATQKALPPRRKIAEEEISEAFLKGSGPGGQKINKTSSAVQLKHIPTGIVVKSQETRSRDQNRKLARQILAEKLDEREHGAQSRVAIKAERARVKKASSNKKSRRKYRKLEEEKTADHNATKSEKGDGYGDGVVEQDPVSLSSSSSSSLSSSSSSAK